MSKKTSKTNIPSKKPVNSNNIMYGFLIILSVVLVIFCINDKFIQDDAFISFRYVQNFVDGNGLVFNIGERVEGYTNFLWVIILSVFTFLGMNIENISQILSVLFGVIVLFITFRLSQLIEIKEELKSLKKTRITESDLKVKYFDLIPSLFLVFTGSFIFWSVSGMETTMFVSFCLFGIYFYVKDRNSDTVNYKFPLFILLAALTRPEGMYFFGLIMLHKFIFAIKENKSAGLKIFFSKNNLISYAVFVIPVIIFTLFRYSYYGYLFPNTFYAKTGLSSVYLNAGIEYFTKFVTSYLFYGIILITPLYLFKRKENFFEISLFYLIIVSYIAYIVIVGGDVLKQNRFFLPVLPLIYILFAKLLTEVYFILKNKLNVKFAFPAIAIIAVLICFKYYSSEKENLDNDILSENGLVQKMKAAGNWFKDKQEKLGRPLNLAATTIGAVSYFSGSNVNVIDLLGLTDKEIAHNPKIIPEISDLSSGWRERNYNADYVMSRDPDYVYFSTGVKPSAYGEKALYTNEEFLKYYYPYYFTDKATNIPVIVYKRKSEEEVKSVKWEYPGNPNYKLTFVNMFNQAMNTSRDQSRAQTAIDEFKQTLEISPSSFGAPYQYIADIYKKQGKKDLAIENFKKAVEVNEDNVIANYELYQLYSEKGDTANARLCTERIQKYDPDLFR